MNQSNLYEMAEQGTSCVKLQNSRRQDIPRTPSTELAIVPFSNNIFRTNCINVR